MEIDIISLASDHKSLLTKIELKNGQLPGIHSF